MAAATDAVPGYLTAADHITFAAKVSFPGFTATAADIKMNGTQGVGALGTTARADHIHPSDTSRVPTTRTISTTAPITGGGDLSADRTLAMAAATTSVDGYMSAANLTKALSYDVSCSISGKPSASQKVLIFPAVQAFTVAATGHSWKCYTNPTATAVFVCAKNGTTFGSLSISTSGVLTLSGFSATSFAVNDILTITAPSSQDATLADCGITLKANL